MHRGVKIIGRRAMSITDNIIEFNKPEIVYIPLVVYNNYDCECLVKPGDTVLKGSVIGRRNDNVKVPIHASVSGKVLGIEEKYYSTGEKVKCIAIQNDFKEKQEALVGAKEKINKYSKEEFIELLRTCAVTGMGGSDFPTYIKYQSDLNTLIVNAVECEPYITADFMIAKLKTEEILEAIDAIMEINTISKCFIAVREGNYSVTEKIQEYIGTYPNISLIHVPNLYPMGWERLLIKEVLDVDYDKIPSEKGIVVNNVSTIYAIYDALKCHKPISRRIITISGERINKPQNVLVKLGTPISEVIKEIGGYKEGTNLKFIAGGPMMGGAIESEDLIVSRNLNCVLIIENKEQYDKIACLRCGRCSSVCPAKLAPVLIRDNVNDFDVLKFLKPERCIDCGLCSYICPSKIDVRKSVEEAKKEIRRH